MSFRNVLYANYWFSQPDPLTGGALNAFYIFFAVLVVSGILCFILRKDTLPKYLRILLGRAGSLAVGLGLAGLLWVGLRQANVFFLAWRFWLLVWLAVFLPLALKILRYILFRIPEIIKEQRAAGDQNK